jgi:hypothetical protein
LDPDLGNNSDDYVGCDTTLNTMYSYNYSNNDAIYGNNPPTIGVVNLRWVLKIEFQGKYSVEIHSLDGRKVFQDYNMNGTQNIYTTIESGSYVISVIHEGNRYTTPIIIK